MGSFKGSFKGSSKGFYKGSRTAPLGGGNGFYKGSTAVQGFGFKKDVLGGAGDLVSGL